MDLVAVDWFKDTKRMDHVARRPGCAAQVSFPAVLVIFKVRLKHIFLDFSILFIFSFSLRNNPIRFKF